MLQQSLPEYKVINSGKSGDTLGGGLARLEPAVLAHKAGYLIIGLGANDYWQQKRSLNDLKIDYETMIARCSQAGMKIVIISCFGNEKLPDDSVIDFNKPGIPREHYAAGLAIIEHELVKKYQTGYVPDMQCAITPKGRRDLWSDSNHPNAAGNRIVADTILPELRKLFP
jgi:lysophospholipase L1-like esterase